MVAVMLVGPSHAGKTALTRAIVEDPPRYGLERAPEVLDLDESLGSSNRSDESLAIAFVRSRASAGQGLLVVNVGAGQVVRPAFQAFVRDEPGVIPVAVWCNESTFRSRHSPETADREFRHNYTTELTALWETCRVRGQLVDTSAPRTVEEAARDLARIIRHASSA